MDDDLKQPEEVSTTVTDATDVEKELEELRAKCKEYLEGWQRAKADFQNYKREEIARLTQAAAYAGEDLIREMITALDSFDLGLASLEKVGQVDRGIYMIRGTIEDALRKKGVVRIVVKPGDPPDHYKMETVGETESEMSPGMIVSEVGSGYTLHEKVLRPARVIVSKEKGKVEN